MCVKKCACVKNACVCVYGGMTWCNNLHLVQKNGQFILWKHIQELYDKMNRMAVQSKGLSLLPKLKLEHVQLNSYSRMRVDLAAQVNKGVH